MEGIMNPIIPAAVARESSERPQRTIGAWIVATISILFFVVPMLAMARFALQRLPVALLGRKTLFTHWTLAGVGEVMRDPKFLPALWLSVRIGVLTSVLTLALLIPTVLWLHLRARRWRMVAEVISLLPYVVPPIALVVGVAGAFRNVAPWFIGSDYCLVPLYVILSLPFAFRTLDVGASAIDLRTMVDASRSLGAGWTTTVWRVVVPNMGGAIITTSFLSFAVVMGEFAVSSLLLKRTLPLYMAEAQGSEPQGAMALGLLLMIFTTLLFAILARVQKRSLQKGQG